MHALHAPQARDAHPYKVMQHLRTIVAAGSHTGLRPCRVPTAQCRAAPCARTCIAHLHGTTLPIGSNTAPKSTETARLGPFIQCPVCPQALCRLSTHAAVPPPPPPAHQASGQKTAQPMRQLAGVCRSLQHAQAIDNLDAAANHQQGWQTRKTTARACGLSNQHTHSRPAGMQARLLAPVTTTTNATNTCGAGTCLRAGAKSVGRGVWTRMQQRVHSLHALSPPLLGIGSTHPPSLPANPPAKKGPAAGKQQGSRRAAGGTQQATKNRSRAAAAATEARRLRTGAQPPTHQLHACQAAAPYAPRGGVPAAPKNAEKNDDCPGQRKHARARRTTS